MMTDTIQWTVTGMTCGGCEQAVRRSLQQVAGVHEVTASHIENRVEVTFDAQQVEAAALRAKVEALGYRVTP